jgi:glycosyltransferase involved in cell wall biosynthesis
MVAASRNISVPSPEISLVVPVYNGGAAIVPTLRRWGEVLAGLAAEIIVIDDGSADGTGRLLDEFQSSGALAGLSVIHQRNAGHGPAVRRGYALARGRWVFQADSDNEVDPEFFRRLWDQRAGFDLVLARRRNRREAWVRRLVTASVPFLVLPWSRRRLPDLNVPFRLIRGETLRRLLGSIPGNAFAPNVLMSILACRTGCAVLSVPVPHRPGPGGGRSLGGRKLLRALRRAAADLARISRRSLPASPREKSE